MTYSTTERNELVQEFSVQLVVVINTMIRTDTPGFDTADAVDTAMARVNEMLEDGGLSADLMNHTVTVDTWVVAP